VARRDSEEDGKSGYDYHGLYVPKKLGTNRQDLFEVTDGIREYTKLIFDMFGRLRGSGGFLHAAQEGIKANESEDMTQERGNRIVKATDTWDTIHTEQTRGGAERLDHE